MDYAAARHNMVESQIRTNRITSAVLIAALSEIPRELFVPKQQRGVAYLDADIALGGGRHLMEPLVLAGLLQALDIQDGDVVLDVGCASGYSSAILSRLAGAVVALESDGELERRTTGLLADLHIDNVAVVSGDLARGDPEHGPYQAIVLEGAVGEIPATLLAQLADGGRLAVVVMEGNGAVGHAVVVTRNGAAFSRRVVFDASTLPLRGFQQTPAFAF